MKATLTTIALAIATSYTSPAGPSWGFTTGSGAGFYWNGQQPQQMPRRHYHNNYRPNVVVFGPQYYRMSGTPCNVPVRNYSNAPIIVDHGCRSTSTIVPRSWR